MRDAVAAARSMLFVPGDRPERFSKAAASGADAIVLDLEDAVGAENKDAARAAVDTWLGEHAHTVAAVVRVNGTETHWHADDVAMLSGHRCAVMLPKATCAAQLRGVAAQLGAAAGVIALIETAQGVLAAQEISSADSVVRTAFGSVDLAVELGVSPDDRDAMYQARGTVILASAAAGRPAPLDGVTTSVSDEDQLCGDTRYAARLGFGGKLCIHPRQIEIVNQGFSPSDTDVAWARTVVEAAGGDGVCVVDGRMVDKPVVDRAVRLLARVATAENPSPLPG
ncbi:(3S)-malyl-CoA thioesterase [Mycolicibacterium obuense]|uniref:(3S)-malyl-CoA thioesterase n=1 Tax=Mycolicibacterium obuense TaxID=1807 RepID=A0A0J6W3S7_9MYCO|nr:(3S)-malyl-CoA thioesterase [Mycolicibacterium obuense]